MDIFEELSNIRKKEEVERYITMMLAIEEVAMKENNVELLAVAKMARHYYIGAYAVLAGLDPIEEYKQILESDLQRVLSENEEPES